MGLATEDPNLGPERRPQDAEWLYCQLSADGTGQLSASVPDLLYAAFCCLRDDWSAADLTLLSQGHLVQQRFPWLAGRDELLTGRCGFLRRRAGPVTSADVGAGMAELARLGCSHVVINELAAPFPHEHGPKGEIYYRFYAYLPDLDQYVESRLNAGTSCPSVAT